MVGGRGVEEWQACVCVWEGECECFSFGWHPSVYTLMLVRAVSVWPGDQLGDSWLVYVVAMEACTSPHLLISGLLVLHV